MSIQIQKVTDKSFRKYGRILTGEYDVAELRTAMEKTECPDDAVNVACTDLILLIGSEQDIEDDYTYDTSKIEAFLLPKGTVAEVYATTLHYAPCSVDGNNFRCVVVLPKDTNLDLEVKPEGAKEDPLLVARNKWLIAHEDAKIEGAFNGLKGENISVE